MEDILPTLAAAGSCLAALAAGVAAFASWLQVHKSKENTEATVLLRVFDMLASEDARAARRHLYATIEMKTELTWEDEQHVYEVAHTFQVLGHLLSIRAISPAAIDTWKRSVNRVWRVVEPQLRRRRAETAQEDYWIELEELAKLCRKRDKSWGIFLQRFEQARTEGATQFLDLPDVPLGAPSAETGSRIYADDDP